MSSVPGLGYQVDRCPLAMLRGVVRHGSRKAGTVSRGGVRALLVTLTVFVLAAVVVVLLLFSGLFSPPPGPISSQTPTPNPTTSTTPTVTAVPTDSPTPSSSPTSGGALAPTSVVIVYTGLNSSGTALDVEGFAEDVIEDGGTCTAKLTGSGGRASISTTARADSTTTTCRTLHVPLDGLAAGAYRVVLSYLSGTASGESAAVDVEIP
ncbi:hypothetical protein BH09ACT4_BH09ACT4_01580 [soil metagenome]